MYKLSIDLDRKLEVMCKHTLNAEQWLFIELLWTYNDGRPEYMFKYFNECAKTTVPRDTLQALKDKKILASDYEVPGPDEEFEPDQVEFSKTFINNYFKLSFEAGQELWDLYPEYCQGSTSKLLIARSLTTKGFNDHEALFQKYLKNIQYKVTNHLQVLEILAWAKEQQLLTFGIAEYVVSRKWNDHIALRDSGESGKHMFKVETLEDVE